MPAPIPISGLLQAEFRASWSLDILDPESRTSSVGRDACQQTANLILGGASQLRRAFAQILDQDLLFAEIRESQDDLGNLVKGPSFGCVSRTWRSRMPGAREASRQSIHRYLALAPEADQLYSVNGGSSPYRLVDRRDLQLNLFLQ